MKKIACPRCALEIPQHQFMAHWKLCKRHPENEGDDDLLTEKSVQRAEDRLRGIWEGKE